MKWKLVMQLLAALTMTLVVVGLSVSDCQDSKKKKTGKRLLSGTASKTRPRRVVAKPTVGEKLQETYDLAQAVEIAMPLFTNKIVSGGSAVLAEWMVKKAVIGDIKKLPKGSYGQTRKTNHRGHHLCVRAKVMQIQERNSRSMGTLYRGRRWYSFLTFKQTTGVLAGRWRTFCGVIAGRVDWKNQRGGETSGIQLVGMFDIKDNR